MASSDIPGSAPGLPGGRAQRALRPQRAATSGGAVTAPVDPVVVEVGAPPDWQAQVQDLERLHVATMQLARATDRATALRDILRATLEAVGAPKGLLSLGTRPDGQLEVAAAQGFPEAFLNRIRRFGPGEGPCGLAFASRARVTVSDVATDPAFAALPELPRLGGFRASHSVPLMTQEARVIGVLTAHYEQVHPPTSREMRLMDLYAHMAADLIWRDQVLEEMRASELRFRTLASHAPVGIFLSDASGEGIYVNHRWCTMAGLSAEEARGRGWQAAIDPEDRPAVVEGWARALQQGTPSEATFRFRRSDGRVTWVQGRALPLRNDAGELTGYIGITTDITSLKRSEDAARAEEDRHRQLLRSLPVALYTTDAEGRLQLFNDAAVELWGRTPDVAHDRWCGSPSICRPDGSELPQPAWPLAVALQERKAPRGVEVIVVRPDGERRHVLAYPHPVFDREGRLTGGMNALVDVTDRRRAEEARSTLAAIVESSQDAIISKDLNSIIRSWNRGAEGLFGYRAEEMIGRSITLLFPPERISEEEQILGRIRQGERVEHFETTRRRKDGSLVEISVSVSPLRDGSGRIIGASKIARDISGRKRAQRELEAARDEAVAASRAKDEFLAALSHELRTPLNPVLLLASNAAADATLPPAVRADFAMVRDNVELEARLIDDLLDITRITRGKLALNLGLHDLHRLLRHALETVSAEARRKRLTLTCDLQAEAPVVRADPVRLQQVFWNILNNAIKFTPDEGQVQLRSFDLPGTGRIGVTITDTGIGMSPGELARVFDAFAQGNHAAQGGSHRFGGLGLGLTISRMLVEAHHGSIRAESAGAGCGCTFTVELPSGPVVRDATAAVPDDSAVRSSPAGTAPVRARSRRRVLVVDDHEPTRAALARLLNWRQFEVTTAGSLAEARSKAAAGGLDLVISDIGLPDGSGYELMRELQARCGLPGIALTGYGADQDLAQSQRAGFAAHLTKPVTVQALDHALAVFAAAAE